MEKCSTNFVPSQKLCAPCSCLNMRSSIRKVLATYSVTDIGTSTPNHNYKMNLARVTSRWNWCFVIIIALSTTLNLTHWFHFATLTQSTKNIPAVECHSPHFVRNWVEHWLFSELMMPSHQRWNVLVQEFTHYLAI